MTPGTRRSLAAGSDNPCCDIDAGHSTFLNVVPVRVEGARTASTDRAHAAEAAAVMVSTAKGAGANL